MERFWCYLVGFAVALALVAGFLIVKSVVEDKKASLEQKMLLIAKKECLEMKGRIYWYDIDGIDQYVKTLIVAELKDREDKYETNRRRCNHLLPLRLGQLPFFQGNRRR